MTYLEAQIFTDNNLNNLADKLFYHLKAKFSTLIIIDDVFCISGSTANVLQTKQSETATNVVFMCSSEEVYYYLASEVQKLTQAINVIKFKERLLIDYGFIKIEIWSFSGTLVLEEYRSDAIFMQEKTTIPKNLL